MVCAGLAVICAAQGADAAGSSPQIDVLSSPPKGVSVTVYRNSRRAGGALRLSRLGGFALITETRRVDLPQGLSRLRFQGVVDGIQPETAIITGLGAGVIEKNRDAVLLSPEALIKASLDADATLVRTDPKTGKAAYETVRIRSANAKGAIFETAEGLEAFQCSGLKETFQFARPAVGLTSTPTLSVLVRTKAALSQDITLSYLARDFDWAANYVVRIAPDGRSLDLGGWITLANGNDVSLKDASLQVVAGRLNRIAAPPPLAADDPRVVIHCWPTGATSDPAFADPRRRSALGQVIVTARRQEPVFMALPPAPAPSTPPPPEELGDLKLYRIGFPTSVQAHQSKQLRLIANGGIPFERLYEADLSADGEAPVGLANVSLRLINSVKARLGLPLPAGVAAVFAPRGEEELLVGETPVADTALDQILELRLGRARDVELSQIRETYAPDPGSAALDDAARGFRPGEILTRVEISNASSEAKIFELRLTLARNEHIRYADRPLAAKDGRLLFRLDLSPRGRVQVRYALTPSAENPSQRP